MGETYMDRIAAAARDKAATEAKRKHNALPVIDLPESEFHVIFTRKKIQQWDQGEWKQPDLIIRHKR